MILQQLNDDLDVVMVVLDGDDSHDVGRVLSIRVFAVLVGQHQTRIRLFHLPYAIQLRYVGKIGSIYTATIRQQLRHCSY